MNLQPGATLGGYTIIERIGRGGMSTVYKAYQPSLSRQVAIKVMPPYFEDDEEMRRRFQQEALTVANLQHPNILVAYEYGEQDGMIYLVSELVDGGTLQEMVGSQQTLPTVVRLLGPIAAALDFAHSRGVLHRDVKPGNILLRRDGTPVLSDFGLVRMLHSSSARLTRTGLTVGTPEYMAPEQGTSEAITAAADIYGLAVMAYELLTGRVPFRAETPMAVLLAHMQEQPTPPSDLNPLLPPAIDAVMLKALAKQPTGRYKSATALIEALEAAGRGEKPIEDSAAALGTIDATLAAADRRAAVAAEVVAMMGTATARRRLRSTMLGGGAVAAALLAAAIWAIVHNAGASTAAHSDVVRRPLPTGTPRSVAVAMRAGGTTREQAALPAPPSATPSATAGRTATTVPTASPTMAAFPASDESLPAAPTATATATATRRPAPPTRMPTVTPTPKATRPRAERPAATTRRATATPRRATPIPRSTPPAPHSAAVREVAAAVEQPRQPARKPTPRPTPAPARPAPTATPRPAVALIVHPATKRSGTPSATRRPTPHRTTTAQPKATPKVTSRHRGSTPQLVLVGQRPMPVARKPVTHPTTKAGHAGRTARASHVTKRKATSQRKKEAPPKRHPAQGRSSAVHRQGSLKIKVKR